MRTLPQLEHRHTAKQSGPPLEQGRSGSSAVQPSWCTARGVRIERVSPTTSSRTSPTPGATRATSSGSGRGNPPVRTADQREDRALPPHPRVRVGPSAANTHPNQRDERPSRVAARRQSPPLPHRHRKGFTHNTRSTDLTGSTASRRPPVEGSVATIIVVVLPLAHVSLTFRHSPPCSWTQDSEWAAASRSRWNLPGTARRDRSAAQSNTKARGCDRSTGSSATTASPYTQYRHEGDEAGDDEKQGR